MVTVDELQKQHEARLEDVLRAMGGRSRESDWALVRALIHKAVHFNADRMAGEFCAMADLPRRADRACPQPAPWRGQADSVARRLQALNRGYTTLVQRISRGWWAGVGALRSSGCGDKWRPL